MAVQKIELGSKGIKRVLSKYKPEEAIAEYVWNGYDATATFQFDSKRLHS